MKNWPILILLSIFLVYGAPSRPIAKATASPTMNTASLDKVAVVVQSEMSGTRRCVESEFTKGLLARGYKVASRSDIAQLSSELKFQSSGITDQDAASAAKFLSVPALFIVTLYPQEGKIGARLIDGSTSQVLWIGNVTKGKPKAVVFGGEQSRLSTISGSALGLGTWADCALTLSQTFPARQQPKATIVQPISGCASQTLDTGIYNFKKVVTLIQGSLNNTAIERDLQDALMAELMKKGFAIPSRSDIDAAISELKLQNSDLTDNGASEIGKFLNAPVIMDISINLIDRAETEAVVLPNDIYRYLTCVNGRLLGVESGEVLWVGSTYGAPIGTTYPSNDPKRRKAIVDLTVQLLHLFSVGPAGVTRDEAPK